MAESDPRQGHVHIRDVEQSDLALFFEHQMDREATRMAAFPAREWKAFLTHWEMILADETIVTQTIVVDGQVAGNLVSWEQEGHHEIGYWVGRAYWGRGVASAALALFTDHVKARPLHAYVAAHNFGSMRVLEKCGFRPTTARDVPSSQTEDGGVEHGIEHLVFVLNS
jgi:RimJ/RimL family protein N-acetyltransferase